MTVPRLGAVAVVLHRGQVLLARRANPPDAGLWGFPGGHVRPCETALAAAARELSEETGIVAAPVAYLTNIDVIRHGADGACAVHYLLAAVRCEYRSGRPVAADDVTEAAWIPVDRILAGDLDMSDRVADVVRLAQAPDARDRKASTASR